MAAAVYEHNGELRVRSCQVRFYDGRVYVEAYPLEAKTAFFVINVLCLHFDWQVSSVAQIFQQV